MRDTELTGNFKDKSGNNEHNINTRPWTEQTEGSYTRRMILKETENRCVTISKDELEHGQNSNKETYD